CARLELRDRAEGDERAEADATDLHENLAGRRALEHIASHRPDHRRASFARAAPIARPRPPGTDPPAASAPRSPAEPSWHTARPRGWGGSAGRGVRSRDSNRATMVCTCALSAVPSPVTACFTSLGL